MGRTIRILGINLLNPGLILTLLGLYLASIYSYLLFHSLVEIFNILVGFSIFIVSWNGRRFFEGNYLLLLGITYLFVGGIDLLHTLAYKGMGVFHGFDANLPTQLWIAGRYLQSVSLLAVPLLIGKRMDLRRTFALYFIVSTALIFFIFRGIFPDCFIEGTGLTAFKRVSEYIICGIFLASIGLMSKRRDAFAPRVWHFLVLSTAMSIGAELAFTFYVSVYGLSNLIGHFLKLFSSYCMYKAITEECLINPYDSLFRDLKQKEERFRFLFEQAPIPYQSLDENGRVLIINQAWLDALGYSREEVVGKWFGDFLKPSFRDFFCERFSRFKAEGAVREVEFEMLPKGGNPILASFDGKVGRDAEGNFIQTHCIFSDVTERRRMEEELRRARDELEIRVQERTVELARANRNLRTNTLRLERLNKELQEFAFIASHDLQEPLRKIHTFSAMIADRYESLLENEGREHLQKMTREVRRMSEQIRSLLAYSQLAQEENPFEPTDLSRVIGNCLKKMEPVVTNSRGMVELGELPVIDADPAQMHLLLHNLIDNSLKFCSECKEPIVRVHAEVESETCRIVVEDNGIGFDEQFSERIFRPFQKLHGRNSGYAGPGIGLTICRKIVDRHSGTIAVKSVPGRGTTFTVTLPLKQR